MISTTEATEAITAAMPRFPAEPVALSRCCGRVLRQAVEAERDQPPFDRVTMDGIAIQYDEFAAGRRQFTIQGTQHAGDAAQTLHATDNCIEIMTGGVLPVQSDCVVPVERLDVRDGIATIEDDYAAERRQFVHEQGSDYRAGDAVLQSGDTISPLDVAVIASCGLTEVLVSRQPTIRVVSTGDELVPAGKPIAAHQVRLSNGPALVAMLRQPGLTDVTDEHIADDRERLRARLEEILEDSDVLILSGGVSMGKADFVPQVLKELGVAVAFHKISQRPGLPMWFGIGAKKQAVFALPGNPVSSLVCCRQYVLPALMLASGRRPRAQEFAALSEGVTFKPQLTNFLPVRVATDDTGTLIASPAPTNTSGDFAALSGTDGYVELRLEQDEFPAGSIVPLHRWISV